MKKSFLLILVFVSMVAFSGNALAAGATQTAFGTGDITGDQGGGADIPISLSPNVEYVYQGDTGIGYSIATQNTSGTKTYGASQDISGMKMANSLIAVGSIPTPSSTTNWASGTWYDVGK